MFIAVEKVGKDNFSVACGADFFSGNGFDIDSAVNPSILAVSVIRNHFSLDRPNKTGGPGRYAERRVHLLFDGCAGDKNQLILLDLGRSEKHTSELQSQFHI